MNEINKITKQEKVNKKEAEKREVIQQNNKTIEAFRLGILLGELFSSIRGFRKQELEEEKETIKQMNEQRQNAYTGTIEAIEASKSLTDAEKSELIKKVVDKID